MALVASGRVLYPDPNRLSYFSSVSASTGFQINATGQRFAWVFPVPRTGTITKVGMRIHTAASAVLSRLGLYTVDGSGNPTTTGYGGSAYATFTPAASTYSEVTLGTPATATAGGTAAAVVEFDSTAGDYFVSASNGVAWGTALGYPTKYNGSAWSKNTLGQVLAMHCYYSDSGGQWEDVGCVPFTGAAATGSFNAGTGGADEYAIKVTVPFACRVAGVWHAFTPVATADHEAILYSGTTALKTAVMDGDVMTTGAMFVRHCLFSSGQTLAAGDTVRAAVRPTTAANLTYRNYTLFAAGSEQSIGVPQGTCQSTRLDQGSWSDQTTTFPLMGLIIDQLDNGAGGASGPTYFAF